MSKPGIYISSQCVKSERIAKSVCLLAEAGFRLIELSGGTKYYPAYRDELLQLQKEYGLTFLVHNYFPPPSQEFVLNLASLDPAIRKASLELCRRAIDDAVLFSSCCYSVHAGFYFEPQLSELGATLKGRRLYPQAEAQAMFKESWEEINKYADEREIKLYIENNVVNQASFQAMGKNIPAMLLSSLDLADLQKFLGNFSLLLDLGHLKVTTHSLGLNWQEEVTRMMSFAHYMHVSDNDGLIDRHDAIKADSSIFQQLSGISLVNKILVLEIRGTMEQLKESFDLLFNLAEKKKVRA